MTEPDGRAATIKKLLNKAEAKGTTPEERDAFNAKATELMLKWGIEEAALADADRAKIENIVQRQFQTDTPKVYSYEITCIGVAIAEALGCRGLLQRTSDGRTNLLVVGFESDVERVRELYVSLAVQAALGLAAWYARNVNRWWSGTDKFNARRSFLRGFASGVSTKFQAIKKQVVENAAPGTDLVLVSRVEKVDAYIEDEMQTSRTRRRKYGVEAAAHGHSAGVRAGVGQTQAGTNRSVVGGQQ